MARRARRVAIDRLETLEDRALLAGATLYVDSAADYTITTNQGAPGLDNGDTVTWNGAVAVPGLIFGTTAFSAIQPAINAADPMGGDTVKVAAGTYNLTVPVNVDRPVTLQGAQVGVDARTRGVVAESIIDASAYATYPGTALAVTAAADNTVIDGFTIQGAHGNQAVGGIWLAVGNTGSTVQNNIIQNNTQGVFAASGSLIQKNLFRNNNAAGPSSGHDIYMDSDTAGAGAHDITITNNTFTNSVFQVDAWAIGVGSYKTAPFTNITVTNNTITNHGRGMYFQYTNGATITGNTITGVTNYGVGLFSAGVGLKSSNFNISNNPITTSGSGVGVLIEAGAYTGPITMANNGSLTFTGTAGDDAGTISAAGYTIGGTTYPLTGVTVLTIAGGDGDDSLVIDYAGGTFPFVINFDGGEDVGDNDSLTVLGNNTQNVIYTPSATTNGNGVVTVGPSTINFSNLEPVDFNNVGTFTLNLPGEDDVVTITEGLDTTATFQALVFSGTSGGVGFESAHVFNTTNVNLNTTTVDGNDTITIASAANAHGNTNLTITTGTGTDTLAVNLATTVAGTFTANVKTITLADNITASTITGSATTVNVSNNTAQIQDAIGVSGATSTVNIAAPVTYTENVDATVGAKNITLAPVATGIVTINGSLTLNTGDVLQVQLASGVLFDKFIVTGAVTLGGATLALSSTIAPALALGTTLTIVDGGSLNGQFAGLIEGSVVTVNGTRYAVSYAAGGGSNVTLTVVQPAVSAVLVNGNLTVTGTGGIDNFTIQVSGANMVTLIGTPGSGTNFTGTGGNALTVGPFAVSGALTVNTGNGADIVNLQGLGVGALLGGKVQIDLGDGNDTLTQTGVAPLELISDLSILGGLGDDAITLGLSTTVADLITFGLAIDTGAGAGDQSITLNGVTANANANLTNSGIGAQSVVLGAGAATNLFQKDLLITQSNAANTGGYSATADHSSAVGRLSIINGNTTGTTSVDWSTSNVGGSANIVNGNATLGNTVLFTDGTIGGNVTVQNGTTGATNTITISDSTLSGRTVSLSNSTAAVANVINMGLGGNATFTGAVTATNSSATGANSIIAQEASFGGNVIFNNKTAGATSNTVTIGTDGVVSVVGNLAITNASSATSNNINVSQLQTSGAKAGDVNINNGATTTTNVTFGAVGANTIGGNMSIKNQATTGVRTSTIDNTTVNGKNGFYLINLGVGNSVASLGTTSAVTVASAFKMEDGLGTTVLNVQNGTFGTINFFGQGTGTDTIDLGGNGVAGSVTVNDIVRITTGGGNDTVRIGTVGTAVLNGSVFITLSAGNDTLIIGDNANSPAFNDSRYQMDGGAGVNAFTGSTIALTDYEATKPGKKLRAKITNFTTYN